MVRLDYRTLENNVSHLSNIDFNIQVARGLVAGFSFVNRFGLEKVRAR